mmetsp:Transcript_59854/g.110835  ORF Transcript_59854/g.110835 Transcript_59854/m.110835 type:complete len:279 (+) Transcript_59854:101-937(+)
MFDAISTSFLAAICVALVFLAVLVAFCLAAGAGRHKGDDIEIARPHSPSGGSRQADLPGSPRGGIAPIEASSPKSAHKGLQNSPLNSPHQRRQQASLQRQATIEAANASLREEEERKLAALKDLMNDLPVEDSAEGANAAPLEVHLAAKEPDFLRSLAVVNEPPQQAEEDGDEGEADAEVPQLVLRHRDEEYAEEDADGDRCFFAAVSCSRWCSRPVTAYSEQPPLKVWSVNAVEVAPPALPTLSKASGTPSFGVQAAHGSGHQQNLVRSAEAESESR